MKTPINLRMSLIFGYIITAIITFLLTYKGYIYAGKITMIVGSSLILLIIYVTRIKRFFKYKPYPDIMIALVGILCISNIIAAIMWLLYG